MVTDLFTIQWTLSKYIQNEGFTKFYDIKFSLKIIFDFLFISIRKLNVQLLPRFMEIYGVTLSVLFVLI